VKNGLKKHFGNYGEITRTFIPKDYESGPRDPRGFVFISVYLNLVGVKLINMEEAKPRDDSSGPRRTPESVMKEGPGKRARLGSDNRSCEPRRQFVPTRPRGPSKPSITTQAKGMCMHSFIEVKT
ncbi:nucleolin-like protein 2, partial [Tanacetum coccineum]